MTGTHCSPPSGEEKGKGYKTVKRPVAKYTFVEM